MNDKIEITEEMLAEMPKVLRAEAIKDGFMNNGEIFSLKGETYTVYILNDLYNGTFRYLVFDEVPYFPYGHPMTDEFFEEHFRLLVN
jgi:hypothetical protein